MEFRDSSFKTIAKVLIKGFVVQQLPEIFEAFLRRSKPFLGFFSGMGVLLRLEREQNTLGYLPQKHGSLMLSLEHFHGGEF